MTVSLSQISQAFDDLIAGAKSRETLAAWATALRQAEDARQLQYEPRGEESRIWNAILYLTGVDLKSSARDYLHNTNDFLSYRQKAGR